MKTKFFVLNKDNKIEFTEEELKKLLDEMYNDGYSDGKKSNGFIYRTPYTNPWYYTYCSSTSDINSITSSNSINLKTSK